MALGSLELKVGSVPGATFSPRGARGPAKGCRSICMEGGVIHFDSAVVNPFLEVSGRIVNSNNEP